MKFIKKAQVGVQLNCLNWFLSVGTRSRSHSARAYKKAQVGVQFNWIFVLIAGGIILLFFFGLVTKQKEVSEVDLAATIVTDLDSIFTSAKVARDTGAVIQVPNNEMQFDCDGYSILGIKRGLDSNIVFAPKSLKGTELITWSQPFNFPFTVENFLYITSKDIRYIFVCGNSAACDIAEKVYEEMPDSMTKEICKDTDTDCVDNLKDENHYKVRIVYFGSNPAYQMAGNLGKADISAVAFESIVDGGLEVNYFKKESNKFMLVDMRMRYSIILANKNKENFETIYAAIFAEDVELYNCMMKRAFKRLSIVSEMVKMRGESIFKDTSCEYLSSKSETGFTKLIEVSKICQKTFPSDETDECSPTKLNGLLGSVFGETTLTTIEGNNVRLQNKGCPLWY